MWYVLKFGNCRIVSLAVLMMSKNTLVPNLSDPSHQYQIIEFILLTILMLSKN
jgi:hypothetical protein